MSPANSKHIALVLLEGETEEEFYRKVAQIKFARQRKSFKNLRGNYNINSKIAEAAKQFSRDNAKDKFDVYVCIDKERIDNPGYNHKLVYDELCSLPNFGELFPVIAILMIESLFFIDIEGIYKFLRARRALRKPAKFAQFRRLTHGDLSKLFSRCGHVYIKGTRCKNFVNSLDICKIVSKAKELSGMVSHMLARS
jgi:hypothetical protein